MIGDGTSELRYGTPRLSLDFGRSHSFFYFYWDGEFIFFSDRVSETVAFWANVLRRLEGLAAAARLTCPMKQLLTQSWSCVSFFFISTMMPVPYRQLVTKLLDKRHSAPGGEKRFYMFLELKDRCVNACFAHKSGRCTRNLALENASSTLGLNSSVGTIPVS